MPACLTCPCLHGYIAADRYKLSTHARLTLTPIKHKLVLTGTSEPLFHAMLIGRRYGLHASPGNRSSNSSLYYSADLPAMHTVWLSAYAGAPLAGLQGELGSVGASLLWKLLPCLHTPCRSE